jgi:hypothetical protein
MTWLRLQFSKLVRYLRQSASEARRWFQAGATFWIWLSVTGIILIVFRFVPGELPDRVRWAGALFELLGVSAVVIGINRARRSFGRPSVLQGVWLWLGDFHFIFFHRPLRTISVSAGMAMGSTLGVATAIGRAPKSIEERIAQIERQISELQTNLGNVEQKVDRQTRELRAELDKEAAARQAADQSVSKKLEEGMVGDSDFELAGVSYLYLGLIMVDLPAEVAKGLAWLGVA